MQPEVTIGSFKRMEEIGRGSFATVYKAVHTVGSCLLIYCQPSTIVICSRLFYPILPLFHTSTNFPV